jgi:rRNA maturation endonuclease Nob1
MGQSPQRPPISRSSQPMAACANCGRTVAIGGRFCPYCGCRW